MVRLSVESRLIFSFFFFILIKKLSNYLSRPIVSANSIDSTLNHPNHKKWPCRRRYSMHRSDFDVFLLSTICFVDEIFSANLCSNVFLSLDDFETKLERHAYPNQFQSLNFLEYVAPVSNLCYRRLSKLPIVFVKSSFVVVC